MPDGPRHGRTNQVLHSDFAEGVNNVQCLHYAWYLRAGACFLAATGLFGQSGVLTLSSGSAIPGGTVTLQLGLMSPAEMQPAGIQWTGAWHHVAVVVTLRQTVRFYVDGALRSTQTAIIEAGGSNAPFQIGDFPGNYYGLPFTGAIDDVRVYRVTLSPSEVAQVYQGM